MGFCHVDIMWAEIFLFLVLSVFLYSCKRGRLNSRKTSFDMSISENYVCKSSGVYPRFPPTVWCLTFTMVQDWRWTGRHFVMRSWVTKFIPLDLWVVTGLPETPKFYFDLASSDTKAGLPILLLSLPRKSSILLLTYLRVWKPAAFCPHQMETKQLLTQKGWGD